MLSSSCRGEGRQGESGKTGAAELLIQLPLPVLH